MAKRKQLVIIREMEPWVLHGVKECAKGMIALLQEALDGDLEVCHMGYNPYMHLRDLMFDCASEYGYSGDVNNFDYSASLWLRMVALQRELVAKAGADILREYDARMDHNGSELYC